MWCENEANMDGMAGRYERDVTDLCKNALVVLQGMSVCEVGAIVLRTEKTRRARKSSELRQALANVIVRKFWQLPGGPLLPAAADWLGDGLLSQYGMLCS